jgi:hypothetical protein
LAIQGSSTPSEHAFSSGGLTGTNLRNRLSPDVFEALQILKSAYRDGLIGSAEEAEVHMTRIDQALTVFKDNDDM